MSVTTKPVPAAASTKGCRLLTIETFSPYIYVLFATLVALALIALACEAVEAFVTFPQPFFVDGRA